MSKKSSSRPKRKIVSSRHLANSEGWQLSEYEFGLIIAFHGFSRWMSKCMSASGNSELSSLEILILHHVNHREKQKRLADVTFLLNIEDTHTVNYALKKLQKYNLIEGEKRGKELFYKTTKSGADLCNKYREVREQCLLDSLRHMDMNHDELSDIAASLRSLSGLYDQASRAASSL